MKTIHVNGRTGQDGMLHLDVPVGAPNVECQVVVSVDPKAGPSQWLPQFLELWSRGWQGEPLVRPEQGTVEQRDALQ